MESIDRLRTYVDGNSYINEVTASCICSLLDGIEREVDEMLRALTIDAKPMTDENMAEHGWVRLPVDADGVPIRVGETVTCMLPFGGDSKPFVVDRMELGRDGDGNVWSVALDRSTDCWEQPLLLRHHHAPTVEDILMEFHERMDELGTTDQCVGSDRADAVDALLRERAELVAEYAKRLRLAEEE